MEALLEQMSESVASAGWRVECSALGGDESTTIALEAGPVRSWYNFSLPEENPRFWLSGTPERPLHVPALRNGCSADYNGKPSLRLRVFAGKHLVVEHLLPSRDVFMRLPNEIYVSRNSLHQSYKAYVGADKDLAIEFALSSNNSRHDDDDDEWYVERVRMHFSVPEVAPFLCTK